MIVAIGDRVNWLCSPRGGYGYRQNVAAVVIGVTDNRVRIRTMVKSGPTWTRVERTVKPASLSARTTTVPIVDEESPCQ